MVRSTAFPHSHIPELETVLETLVRSTWYVVPVFPHSHIPAFAHSKIRDHIRNVRSSGIPAFPELETILENLVRSTWYVVPVFPHSRIRDRIVMYNYQLN